MGGGKDQSLYGMQESGADELTTPHLVRQDHLSTLTEGLSLRLSYFAILPASTSFLSSPSLSLVTSNDFLLTLERLDVALAFVRAHPHYRDAALYKMRFEHCVVRAGTLARMYIMSRLNSLATEVGVRLKEWDRTRGTGKGKEREFDADNDPMMVSAFKDRAAGHGGNSNLTLQIHLFLPLGQCRPSQIHLWQPYCTAVLMKKLHRYKGWSSSSKDAPLIKPLKQRPISVISTR